MPIARVALAIRRLDDEIALAMDGEIERRVRILEAAFAEVTDDTAVGDEAERLHADLALGRAHAFDEFVERRRLALVSGRRDVREIVRDQVHRAIGRDLVRKTYEQRVFHRGLWDPFW